MKVHPSLWRAFIGFSIAAIFIPTSGMRMQIKPGPSQITDPALAAHEPEVDPGFGRFPLQFIPNQGQMDPKVDYILRGFDKTLYFTSEGLTFRLESPRRSPDAPASSPDWIMKLEFVGADPGVRPEGLEETSTVVSYFKGQPDEWKAGLRPCKRIIYRDLWPGIDLLYSGTQDRLKYEFVVRPGADPGQIRLAYRGADGLALTPEGGLSVRTPAGSFDDAAPIAYQEAGVARSPVAAAFKLEGKRRGPACAFGFAVGEFDRSRVLILDPSSLVYCGFIGNASVTTRAAVAVDALGCAYVTGTTSAPGSSFPVTVGPDLTYNGGNTDVFIAKVNAAGTDFEYLGYIGGSEADTGVGVAVDAFGCAYVTGTTRSPETTFPAVVGPGLAIGEFEDAFVAKVDATGVALVYCGYIGGEGIDYGTAIAVDAAGGAYVAGTTTSAETSFPVAVGPDLVHNCDPDEFDYDTFVAKVEPSGAALAYCGYVGCRGDDFARSIAVDGEGQAYLVGDTLPVIRLSGDLALPLLPVMVGPDLTWNGSYEAFVAKITASGSGFVYCGYIGGQAADFGTGIAVDAAGSAYVGGRTYSDESTFPVVRGPGLTHEEGAQAEDAFVAKIDPTGATLLFCGFIGGSNIDFATGIAVDPAGSAYIVGETRSSEATFPVTVGPGLVRRNRTVYSEAFVAKVDPTGERLLYCGYITGLRGSEGHSIAVDGLGHAYVAGDTSSSAGYWGYFPYIVGPNHSRTEPGIFLAKVEAVPAVSDPELLSIDPSTAHAGDPPLTVTVTGRDFVEGAHARWNGTPRPTTYVGPTELRVEIEEGDLQSGVIAPITVVNTDGEASGSLGLTVYNPVPHLTGLDPDYVPRGGSESSALVLGSNFVPTSVVRWNGTPGSTSYLSPTLLDAAVPAEAFAAGGEFQVTVENSAPAGGVSEPLTFRVAGFSLTPSPASVAVHPGDTAAFNILVKPEFAPFDNPVTFSCTGLPSNCTASFRPASPTPWTNWLETTLSVKTKAPAAAAAGRTGGHSGTHGTGPAALILAFLAAALVAESFVPGVGPRRAARRRAASFASMVLAVVLVGCGTGGGGGGDDKPPTGGTPAGTYNLTVTGTSGTLIVTTSVTLVVEAGPPHGGGGGDPEYMTFVYLTHYGSNDISAFAANEADGELAAVRGSPFTVLSMPVHTAVHPSGEFAFVACGDSRTVAVMRIDPRSGALSEAVGSPYAIDGYPARIVADPGGTFLYTLSWDTGQVFVHRIEGPNATLIPVPGSPFPTGSQPDWLAVHPGGHFLYTVNTYSDDISGFRVDPSTGALTEVPGSPFAVGDWPACCAVDATGTRLYATVYDEDRVAVYDIDQATGSLAGVDSVPVPRGSKPSAIAIEPAGKFVYVTNSIQGTSSRTVLGYTVDPATGLLAAMEGSPFTAGVSPNSMAITSSGKHAYVANGIGSISGFRIDAVTGRLWPLGGSPFGTRTDPTSIATVRIKQ
jgi:6-phosphogluconolactonase (cycloisomerase 2 family)